MGKLKALAYTGLALLLAGIVGCSFGCTKKEEHYDLNNELWYRSKSISLLVSVDGKEGATKIKDRFSRSGEVANLFEKGILRTAQGKEDSAKIYFKEAMNDLGNCSDTVKNAAATAILLGPCELYRGCQDSSKKYLCLAESWISEKTPSSTKFYIYNGLGDVYSIDSPDLAIHYYKKALENINHLGQGSVTQSCKEDFKRELLEKIYGLSKK